MATATDENMLLLIEIMAAELRAIHERCRDVRFSGQIMLARLSEEEGVAFEDVMDFDAIRDYDRVLEEVSNRSRNLNRMAAERVRELIGPTSP